MKIKFLLFLAILLTAASCSNAEPTIKPVDTALFSESPADTTSLEPAESNGNLLELPTPVVGTVALDFSEQP